MQLQESGEMYLEAIYVLSIRLNNVRSIDIGEYLGYSKPSVSRAVGLLKGGGYILIDSNGYITLTDAGKELASSIYERHTIISDFLSSIGVSRATADEDACRIEHIISKESFEAIKKLKGTVS